jgi:ADP-ribose pyrophosphatase
LSDLYEKTISETDIYKGRIIELKVKEVQLPNGEKSKREVVLHPGAVAILAVTPEKKIVLVRQFRKALERTIVEIPAGKLEKGEEPITCARRELEEETGYRCGEMKKIGAFYTSPGFADEFIHVYFTEELSKGTVQTDEDEFVELMEVSLTEALNLIETEEIIDAKTVFAIQYLQMYFK